jgi:hypothetical protein
MAIDPSHDSRSAADATARPDDIDPWSEFLSESSEELQQLQSTRSTTSDPSAQADEPRPGVSIVPLAGDGESPFADELPPEVVATTTSPEDEPTPTSAVPQNPGSLLESAPASFQVPPSEPEPAAAPPRDGAPPFTRRFTVGRSYDLPVPVAPPIPAPDIAPPTIFRTVGDDAASLPLPPVPSAEERSRASLWKTPSEVDDPALRRSDTTPEAAVPNVTARETARATIPAPPTAPARRPVKHTSDSLSLSDVLSRQTPVHWPEAVATVQELCVTLDTGNADQVLLPDLADIFITSAGGVGVKQGAPGETDVAALGRTLRSLLATSSTPLPLRLFITSAVSSGRYASVALFADALSYYATSGRTQLVQALYKRAMERTPVLPVVAPRQQLARPEQAPSPRVASRDRLKTWTFAAAVGLVASALAGVWLWTAGLSSEGASTAATDGEAPSTQKRTGDWTPGPILVEGARQVASATPAPPVERRPAPRPSREVPQPASSTPPAQSGPPQTPSAPLVTPDTRPAAAEIPPPPAPVISGPEPAPAPPPPSPKAAVVVDSRTYSAADLDVEQPVLLSPMLFLPSPASPTERVVERTLELVIDSGGTVQSAKLLERPTLSDYSVTQPAKLLKFRPATKEGRAVMYLYRMRLTPPPR